MTGDICQSITELAVKRIPNQSTSFALNRS